MNPRHRRLLIPGLLIALLVVVVISSLVGRAEGAEGPPGEISTISDRRITESSGLAVSPDDPDLAYTVNDSGNDSILYAVRISTGRVVGATALGVTLVDAEALAIDPDGTIWIADTGDNRQQRTDVALYSLPPPGEGDSVAKDVTRHLLTYPDGPRDVEALAIDPASGRTLLLTKGLLAGEVYAVPERLGAGPTTVEAVEATVPGVVTDAAFTPDGRYVVARDYGTAHVLDATTFEEVASKDLPKVEQGESLAVEADGTSYLVGSEGKDSPLIRVLLPDPSEPTPPSSAPVAGQGAASTGEPRGGNGFAGATWLWAGLVVALLATICVAATRKR
jgi:hypothetical protein